MTVKDYIELQDKSEIDVIIRFSQKSKEKIDWLQLGSYENWEFDFVKEMQQRINELCFYDFVVICDDYFKKKIGGMELFNAIQSYNYFLNQIVKTIEIENELLSGETDADSRLAGIENLESLGAYLQIRAIAIALHIKIDEVKKMKYSDALLELITQKRLNDYQSRLIEIKTKKYKK